VLQIGCGNSNLGEQLHDSCGLQRLINLDLSATVIEQMRSKRPDLHWMKGDALMLSAQFGEAAFDAVFDKGTLQSVLLMRGGIELSQVRKRVFLRHYTLKMMILPRQARDKHRESTQKRTRFCRCSLRRSTRSSDRVAGWSA